MADSSSHHLSNLLIGSDTPATLPCAKAALTSLHEGSGCLLPSHCNSFCKYLIATLFLFVCFAVAHCISHDFELLFKYFVLSLTFYIVHYPKYLASSWSASDCVLSCFLFYPFSPSFVPSHPWAFTCPTLGNCPHTFVVLRFLSHDTVSLKNFTIYLGQDNSHIQKALLPL